jgi:alpha-methylacyl-CoA racemase
VAVGALEPKFWAELVERAGLRIEELPPQDDRERWPELRRRLSEVFRGRTRDEWSRIFAGGDACVAPVLSLAEAPGHPHLAARSTFVAVGGVVQPAPAPRFSRTPGAIQGPPPQPGADTSAVLADWGFSAAEIEHLRSVGVVGGERMS